MGFDSTTMNITIHISYIDTIGDRTPITVVSSMLEENSIGDFGKVEDG